MPNHFLQTDPEPDPGRFPEKSRKNGSVVGKVHLLPWLDGRVVIEENEAKANLGSNPGLSVPDVGADTFSTSNTQLKQ